MEKTITRKVLDHLTLTKDPTATGIARALNLKMPTVSSVLSKGASAGALVNLGSGRDGRRGFRYAFKAGYGADKAAKAITEYEKTVKRSAKTKPRKRRATKEPDVGVSLTLRFGGRNHPCSMKEAHDLWEQLNQFFDAVTSPE